MAKKQAEAADAKGKAAAKKTKKLSKKSDKKVKASSKKASSKNAQAKKKGKDGKAAKPNIFRRFVNYCKAVKSEMTRVTWPTRKELINASLIVVGALVFFGVFIAIVDGIVTPPLNWIAALNS